MKGSSPLRQTVAAPQKEGESLPIHIVSAFAASAGGCSPDQSRRKIQRSCRHPKLWDRLAIAGDRHHRRMGLQRASPRKSRPRKAEYILDLKGDQGTLRDDVERFFNEQKPASNFKERPSAGTKPVVPITEGSELKKHRHSRCSHACGPPDWPGLRALVMIDSQPRRSRIGREKPALHHYRPIHAKIGRRRHQPTGASKGPQGVTDMVSADEESQRQKRSRARPIFAIARNRLQTHRQRLGNSQLARNRKVAAGNDKSAASDKMY